MVEPGLHIDAPSYDATMCVSKPSSFEGVHGAITTGPNGIAGANVRNRLPIGVLVTLVSAPIESEVAKFYSP